MAKQLSDEQIYELAKKRVKDKKAFWKHLIAYVIVNLILLTIYVLSDWGERPPFLWVTGIWGVFVIFHYVRVFVLDSKTDAAAIEKEAEKIRKEQS